MANFTKEMLIQTLIELLNERPLSKITVKDIVERCGVNRNTFYYHFRDITDVMEYALKRELDRIIHTEVDLDTVMEGLFLIVRRLEENKKAILHIYRSLPRERFQKHLNDISLYIIEKYAAGVEKTLKLPEEDRRILIHVHKCLFVGVLLDWLEAGMEYDLAEYNAHITELYGDTTTAAIQKAKSRLPLPGSAKRDDEK